jgi:thioredoxin-related protein
MKMILSLIFLMGASFPLLAQSSMEIGTALPKFSEAWGTMKGLDGKDHTLQTAKGEKGTLVVFTCVHCPFVKAWDKRLTALSNEFLAKGIQTIWINSNDYESEPRDKPEEMKKQIAALGLNSKIPYVIDSTSNVARAFGATRTPEIFLFNAEGKLAYKGAIDSSHTNPPEVGSTDDWLRLAMEQVLAGKAVENNSTKSMGCSIKFRKQQS